MSMTITVERPKDIQAVLEKGKRAAEKHNIFFAGDDKHGYGSGFNFEATYTVGVDFITICVMKKPVLITKGRIEKEVKKYLSQG